VTPLLYIVRHGQTDWNVEQRLQGQAEVDVNEAGLAQVERNARRLAELVSDPSEFAFVSSPMRRTRATMERVRQELGLPRGGYDTDPRLMELHFGDWQGSTYAELEARQPGSTIGRHDDKWDFVPPGPDAESYAKLAKRVSDWLAEVDRPTICSTHGGVIRTLFHLVAGVSTKEAANIPVPQDLVLRVLDGTLEWL
jgi:broad specificity phosphatase PhoE